MKNRLTNPLYGTFIISWLVFHWNFIITLFFVSEDKIWQTTSLLKNDYLRQILFNPYSWVSWVSWVAPFLLTYFLIWIMPGWILIKAFNKTEEYESQKNIIKLRKEIEIERIKTELETEKVKKTKVVSEKITEEKKIKSKDPSTVWQEQLENLVLTTPVFIDALKAAVNVVYKTSGNFTTRQDEARDFAPFLPPEYLSRIDTIGLVKISKGTYGNKIDFTEKGKFFVNKLQEQNKI